jgi:hypothetical protein
MIRRCLAVSSTAAIASQYDAAHNNDDISIASSSAPPPAQQLQALTSILDSLFNGAVPLNISGTLCHASSTGAPDIMSPFSRPSIEPPRFVAEVQQVILFYMLWLLIWMLPLFHRFSVSLICMG